MSRENLDVVRSIFAAWERGDFSSAAWAHPEIDFVIADGPEPGRWQGAAQMAQGWGALLHVWEDLRAEAEEYRELDADRVLVLTHNRGRGKGSGLDLGQMQTRGANLFRLRNNKVDKLVAYFDRNRALADLGLAAETSPPGS